MFILSKANRSLKENQILTMFLETMEELVSLIREACPENYDDLLRSISFSIKHEQAYKNRILFKYGEKGEKFYIILKGQAAILLPKDEKMAMTEDDYLKYLIKLRKNDEIELLNKCVSYNRSVYPIEGDDFEIWMRNLIENSTKSPPGSPYRYSRKSSSMIRRTVYNDLDDAYRAIQFRERIKEDDDIFATVDEYIDRNLPIVTRGSSNNINQMANTLVEKKNVTVFKYHHVLTLNTGDKFGDIALDSISGKRSASVILLADTHFGILDKRTYEDCIKEANEKKNKLNLNFITNNQLFSHVSKGNFKKSFFNYFVLKRLHRKEKLITEGTHADTIYIIKEGEFEVSFKKSNIEIKEIIRGLGGKAENQKIEYDEMEGIHIYIIY